MERQLWSVWTRRRDATAFEALVRPHLAFAVDMARRMGCGPSDADDIVQQSVVDLSNARGAKPARVGIRAWLGRTVISRARMFHRAQRRRRRHEGRAAAPAPKSVDQLERRDDVEAALDALEAKERIAVTLRYLHDLEYVEVARILGISAGAARLRVHRAISKLRLRFGRGVPTLVAAIPLLCGDAAARMEPAALIATPPAAVAALGGGILMGTTVKMAVGAAAVLAIVWLLGWHPWEADETPDRASRKRPAPLVTASSEDPLQAGETGDRTPDASTGVEQDPVTRRQLETDMQLARLDRGQRALTAEMDTLMRELGRDDKTPPTPDGTMRAHLERLVQRYRSLPAGDARTEILKSLVETHTEYLNKTADPAFVPMLKTIATRAEVEAEWHAVILALPDCGKHGVAILTRLLEHAKPGVRISALRGLSLAAPGVAFHSLLEDGHPRVRWSAALWASDTAAILDRLKRESHPLAAEGMVEALRVLDPGGRARIEESVAGSPAPVREAAFRVLDRRSKELPAVAGTATLPKPKSPTRRADEDGREYLGNVQRDYGALATGAARRSLLEAFRSKHRTYFRQTGDRTFLPFLDRTARESTDSDERVEAVRALGDVQDARTIELVTAHLASPDHGVRSAAIYGLARMTGEAGRRAHREIPTLLADPHWFVRTAAAMSLGHIIRDPAQVDAILKSMETEEDDAAAFAEVKAVVTLDPARGRARIRDVRDRAGETTRTVLDRALAELD